jgi:DNA-binding NtrC family response regulator
MKQYDKKVDDKKVDKTVEERIRATLDSAAQKYLGMGVMPADMDITDRLKKDSLLSFYVDTRRNFKQAKKQFKKHYLEKVIQIHSGNISLSAKVAGIDRRSIHRLMTELGIVVDREKLVKENYTGSVQDMITGAIESTKPDITPFKQNEEQDRFMRMYKRVAPTLSREIVRELPSLSLDEAEAEFEKRFFEKALVESKGNISATARKIGLRFETLHRKMKDLNIT